MDVSSGGSEIKITGELKFYQPKKQHVPPRKLTWQCKNPTFEDIFPIENGDFPASHSSFQGCIVSQNIAPLQITTPDFDHTS